VPALTFATMKTELSDRGFDDLSDTRLGYFINQARAELDGMYKWPYRLTTATGSSPLTITDLGSIEEVVDLNQPSVPGLTYTDRRSLKDAVGDLTVAGTPVYFYIDNGVVRTWPVGGSLSVRYYKRPADLTGVQVPLAPSDYHLLIVDMACRWAHKDREDAPGLDAEIARQLALMVRDQFGQQIVGSDLAPVAYESSDW
jgi:hypothetical protein